MGWYDRRTRQVRDLSCGDTRIYLEFEVRRVQCRSCGRVKRERLDFLADNLIVIVDKNDFQAMGSTNEVMGLGDIEAQFAAFGLDAVTVDGHDEPAIDAACRSLRSRRDGRPKAIVARTVKGKGVFFMERNNVWHYTRLAPATYQEALAELKVHR